MEEERHIRKYFKPAGLGQKMRKAFVDNLKLQKALKTPLDDVDSLKSLSTETNKGVEEADQIFTVGVNIEKNLEADNVVGERESHSACSQDFVTTSNYRKKSLMRAKVLVSKALKDTTECLKAGKKVPTTSTFKSKVSVRKRLFDRNKNVYEDDPPANQIENTQKYEQLKEKLPAVPAFKRFKHLIDTPSSKILVEREYPYETEFPLPAPYEKLLQFYKAADAVLYMMYQRKEGCNFIRLKKMIEASTKKTFWRSDLAKIAGLRPNDFKIYLNENPGGMTKLLRNESDKRDNVLMISPDYTEALEKFHVSESPISKLKYEHIDHNLDKPPCSPINMLKHTSPCKTPRLYSPVCVSPMKSTTTYQTPHKSASCLSPVKLQNRMVRPSHLTWRKDQVHSALLRKTHDQHKSFLNQIGLDNINYTELKQWHTKFNLDDADPIDEATLPDAFKIKTKSTAKDLLSDTEVKLNSVIRKAVEDVVKTENMNSDPSSTKEQDDNDASSGVLCLTPVCQKVLSSIPDSLIEKIREKEKKNALIRMIIKQDGDEEKNKLQKLPELLKLIFNYLRSEKKTCMILSKVVEKMMQSTTLTISRELMEEHIVLLSRIVPDLVSIPTVGNHRFVKIVQIKCTLNDALGIIQAKISAT